MDDIDRIQNYYREIARRQYTALPVGAFDCYFHPSDSLIYFNYAIPRSAPEGDVSAAVAQLRAEFMQRRRRPRFEFIERFAPGLAPRLAALGFSEESRLHMMTCTAKSYLQSAMVEGLTILRLDKRSPVGDVTEFLQTRQEGFTEIPDRPVEPAAIAYFYTTVDTVRPYLARMHGRPVSVGLYTLPLEGISDIAGIATIPPARFQGIAGMLTARLVGDAFAEGAKVTMLTARDERAGRVYERVGFMAYARMLAYSDPSIPV